MLLPRPLSRRRPLPHRRRPRLLQTAAETAQADAEADAAAELKIADTVKSVGDTTIDAAASSQRGDHRRRDGGHRSAGQR